MTAAPQPKDLGDCCRHVLHALIQLEPSTVNLLPVCYPANQIVLDVEMTDKELINRLRAWIHKNPWELRKCKSASSVINSIAHATGLVVAVGSTHSPTHSEFICRKATSFAVCDNSIRCLLLRDEGFALKKTRGAVKAYLIGAHVFGSRVLVKMSRCGQVSIKIDVPTCASATNHVAKHIEKALQIATKCLQCVYITFIPLKPGAHIAHIIGWHGCKILAHQAHLDVLASLQSGQLPRNWPSGLQAIVNIKLEAPGLKIALLGCYLDGSIDEKHAHDSLRNLGRLMVERTMRWVDSGTHMTRVSHAWYNEAYEEDVLAHHAEFMEWSDPKRRHARRMASRAKRQQRSGFVAHRRLAQQAIKQQKKRQSVISRALGQKWFVYMITNE